MSGQQFPSTLPVWRFDSGQAKLILRQQILMEDALLRVLTQQSAEDFCMKIRLPGITGHILQRLFGLQRQNNPQTPQNPSRHLTHQSSGGSAVNQVHNSVR